MTHLLRAPAVDRLRALAAATEDDDEARLDLLHAADLLEQAGLMLTRAMARLATIEAHVDRLLAYVQALEKELE